MKNFVTGILAIIFLLVGTHSFAQPGQLKAGETVAAAVAVSVLQ